MTKQLSEAFFGDKKLTEVLHPHPENIPSLPAEQQLVHLRRHQNHL